MSNKFLTNLITSLQVLLKNKQKHCQNKKKLIFFILALKTKAQLISLSPAVPEDVEDLINSMKTNKASGPNSIPTDILKLFKKEFSKPLSNMIICVSIKVYFQRY